MCYHKIRESQGSYIVETVFHAVSNRPLMFGAQAAVDTCSRFLFVAPTSVTLLFHSCFATS